MAKVALLSIGRGPKLHGLDIEDEELGAKEHRQQQLGYWADVNYSIIDPNLR